MKFEIILNFILLLICSIALSLIVGMILDLSIFNVHGFGFQYVMFAVLGSFVYLSYKFLRYLDTLMIVVGISGIFTFFLKDTTLLSQMGGFIQLYFYIFFLFLIFSLALLWFNKVNYLRSLIFGIIASLGYTVLHLIIHLLIKREILAAHISQYFVNAFVIMITIGASFSLVDFIMIKIKKKFLDVPDKIIMDKSDEPDDQKK